MKLHENPHLFSDAINAASSSKSEGGLGINSIFIEKDYWICRSLALMAANDKGNHTVFKGGTSLTKAYGIGSRFSEDIDIAISNAWELNDNQLKNLIRHTEKAMMLGLKEIPIPGITSKGSHFRKVFYQYPRHTEVNQIGAIKAGQLLVEINSFGNPYPSQKCQLRSLLTDFFTLSGNSDLIENYDMQPFEVQVLDKKTTMTEKLVSLLRCSLSDNPIIELSAKIRHFYDLYFLYQDNECLAYLNSEKFISDFHDLLKHDQKVFELPEGWQTKSVSDSPLLHNFDAVWEILKNVYLRELPYLAYRAIPDADSIKSSLQQLINHLHN
jgi:hypothetical protein